MGSSVCQAAFLKAKKEERGNHGAPLVKVAGGCLLTEGVVTVTPAARPGRWEIVSWSGLGGADATGVCLHWWQ